MALAMVTGFLFANALLSLNLALFLAGRKEGSASALSMALLMGATGGWAVLNAFEYMVPGLGAKLLFADLQYIFIAAIPVFWFAFGRALDREERGRAVHRPTPAIWAIPLATATLVWFDPSLGLVRRSFALAVHGGLEVIDKEFGPWFWVNFAYSYALVIAGTVLVLRGIRRQSGSGKARVIISAAGTLLPLTANVSYVVGLFPSRGVDPTPMAFALTGLLLVLNLAKYRFLVLIASARTTAVEQQRDPAIVLDTGGRIAYLNAAARSGLGLGEERIGQDLSLMDPPLSDLASLAGGEQRELVFEDEASPARGRRFEARASTISRQGREIGLVITLFDVTRRVAAEDALKVANQDLERRIYERTEELEASNERLSAELEYRIKAERQLAHDALHDPLTSLANRSLLSSRVEQAILRARRDPADGYCLLSINLDGFHEINETLGRNAGDALLLEMASRLKRSFREVDTIARIGADEFVVLLEGGAEAEALRDKVERVAEELSLPAALGYDVVVPSLSIGFLRGDRDYGSATEAIRDADIALQRAKGEGKNRHVLFEEAMRESETERNRLRGDLRAAIGSGGIGLAYQPIVHMDGSLAGWEVLARWRSPSFGQVGPDRFIPIAEESGLIVPLGTYVLIEALREAALLRELGLLEAERDEPPYFSVNVSSMQLLQGDFAELVLSAVERAGLPRSMLHLEITESALIERGATVAAHLRELSSAGISFKLDDFGTGYSCLGYLNSLPIDAVKIDQGFTGRLDEDSEGAGLVRGIISLAHDLGKSVIAEGVEREAQLAMLREYGCDCCQGWYFGRPVDREGLEESLAKRVKGGDSRQPAPPLLPLNDRDGS